MKTKQSDPYYYDIQGIKEKANQELQVYLQEVKRMVQQRGETELLSKLRSVAQTFLNLSNKLKKGRCRQIVLEVLALKNTPGCSPEEMALVTKLLFIMSNCSIVQEQLVCTAVGLLYLPMLNIFSRRKPLSLRQLLPQNRVCVLRGIHKQHYITNMASL